MARQLSLVQQVKICCRYEEVVSLMFGIKQATSKPSSTQNLSDLDPIEQEDKDLLLDMPTKHALNSQEVVAQSS
ncbi:hypothetical protein O9992_11960 [Vibrio lentus]|nr:hypothetical protein [Vibrio lentus]